MALRTGLVVLFLVAATAHRSAFGGLFTSLDVGELASEIISGKSGTRLGWDPIDGLQRDTGNNKPAADAGGNTTAIILTSTPEPSAQVLTALALLVGLVVFVRRKLLSRRIAQASCSR